NMIVLEKWDPDKPLSAIYWDGERELYYVKRFLIEHPDKEEIIITDHPNSYLEKIFTDYRPVAEVVFVKKRGQDRQDNLIVDLEEFISIKGITALGNQLTKDKVLEINALEPLPYEKPEEKKPEDIDVVVEEDDSQDEFEENSDEDSETSDDLPDDSDKTDSDGQGRLF